MGIVVVAKNHLQPPKIILKIISKNSKSFIRFNISQVIACYSHVICMSIVCTRKSHVYNLYDIRMYAHVIQMSLLCALILSICTLMSCVCHSYVICMSFVCSFTMNPHNYAKIKIDSYDFFTSRINVDFA